MSSIASGTLQIIKPSVSLKRVPKKHIKSSTFSSKQPLLMLSAKLLNPNNGFSSSSKSFRPVMQWQDVTVKMEVAASASVAYKLYADRELFPKWMPFLSSVEEMEGSPDLSRYLVKLESFGHNIEYYFLAKQLQPIPDRKLHWRSIEGFANKGSIRFFPRGPSSCLVEINFSFEVPNALGPFAHAMKPFMEKLIRGGLESFAAFVKTI